MNRPSTLLPIVCLFALAACGPSEQPRRTEPVDLVPATERVDAVPGADPTKVEPPTAGVDAVPAETAGDRQEAAKRIPDSDR